MAEPAGTVLLVDDDAAFRHMLGRGLTRRGYRVIDAADTAQALAAAAREPVDAAVVDLVLEPDGSGLALIEPLLEQRPGLRILVLTGYASIATTVTAIRRGAADYLAKPASVDEIVAALRDERAPADRPESAPSLRRLEWEHIARTLEACDGNVSEAARRLGMHRRTLQRRLRKRPVQR